MEKTDTQKFENVLGLTLKLCSLNAEQCPCSRGTKKRWSDLASFWYSAQADGAANDIFYTVLHKVHWGLYPDGTYDEELQTLLQLIEAEIMEHSCAFKAWYSMAEFKSALTKIQGLQSSKVEDGPGYHSMTTYSYLNHRTNILVRGKEQCHHDAEFCQHYESIVKRLIPESAEWTYQQWSDDKVLFQEIASRYKVNYIGNMQDFGRMFSVLRGLWCYGSKPTLNQLLDIENLTPELSLLIWPNDTEELLVQTFLDAYKRCKPINGYEERLGNSGICKLLNRCFVENELSGCNSQKVKRLLYDAMIKTV